MIDIIQVYCDNISLLREYHDRIRHDIINRAMFLVIDKEPSEEERKMFDIIYHSILEKQILLFDGKPVGYFEFGFEEQIQNIEENNFAMEYKFTKY